MNEPVSAEQELIREGLTSYWDARYAIASFEHKIQSAAKEVMKAHLLDLKDVLGLEQQALEEKIQLIREEECQIGHIIIGVAYGWDPGIWLGIGWHEVGGRTQPMACCSIPTSAAARRDKALKALRNEAVAQPHSGIKIAPASPWPYRATVWSEVVPEIQISDLVSQMNDVLSAVIAWSKNVGGLRKVMYS